jgi:hypothetical protein
LGGCVLTDLRVYELDLSDENTCAQRLRDYLLGRGPQGPRKPLAQLTPADRMTPVEDVDGFIARHVEALLGERRK